MVDVFMKIHRILGEHLDKAAAYVRAMVGYTLEVVEDVRKNETVLNGAFALLES